MMKYCQNCGEAINDNAIICIKCGCSVQATNNGNTNSCDDSVSAGLVILAILVPLFGIVYWPVKAKTRPRCAKACGIAGIVSWVVSLIVSIVLAPVYYNFLLSVLEGMYY